MERLTRNQMAEKYPDQFLGLINVRYAPDGITVEEGDVAFTDKSKDELLSMQIDGSIIRWFTTAEKHASMQIQRCL